MPSGSNFPQISLQTAGQYVQVNNSLQAVVPANYSGIKYGGSVTTVALTLAIFGGDFWSGSAFTNRVDGTIALTASTVNYIEENPSTGAITKNTGSPSWTTGLRQLYEITTGANGITLGGVVDYRRIAWQDARVRFNSVDFVVGATAPTTGLYSPSAGLIRTPNSVTIDDNLTVSGTGTGVNFSSSNAGATNSAKVGNTSNTANSDARFLVQVGGTSGGDPHIAFYDGTSLYAFGADTSDGMKIKVAANTPSGTAKWTLDPATGDQIIAGNLTVSGTSSLNNATATPSGGSSSAFISLGTTAQFGIYYGSGVPTVSAAQGSIYLRSDGSSTSTRAYINVGGSPTTWTAITTAA